MIYKEGNKAMFELQSRYYADFQTDTFWTPSPALG